MAEQIRRLEAFFKRRPNTPDEDGGDDNTYGEYWEFQDPDEVEKWSMVLDPMTGWAHFVHKFKTSPVFLPISNEEQIKDVLHEKPDTVLVHCVTIAEEPYMFTICIDYSKSPFDLPEFLHSLQNTEYERLLKDIERSVDRNEWVNKQGHPLKAAAMVSKVRHAVTSLDVLMATNRAVAEGMKAIELAGQLASQGGSIASGVQGAGSSRSRVPIPSTSKRQQPGGAPTQSKRARVTRPAEGSTASAVTQSDMPTVLGPGESADYNETKTMYEKFWSECQECFVFEVNTKFSVSIDQMFRSPKDWTIREYEEKGMQDTLNFLVHMPDPSVKQTLCLMPDTNEKPTDWDAIKNGKFYIINGQHSVAASQKMKETGLPDEIIKPFLHWNCFIVWSKDKSRLRRISGYYNRCNHLGVFKPTWATNVLGARFIWTELGRPKPPKSATQIGRVVKRTKNDAVNDRKYKVNYLTNPSNV
jgi:hypothetical protein